MLQFESIGNGNCLYNSQAVCLIYAYQQGQLNELLNNHVFVENMGKLLRKISEDQDNDQLSTILGKKPTKKSVQAGLDAILASVLNKKNQINWIKLQQLFAPALRAIVVDAIANNPQVKPGMVKDLNQILDRCIEIGIAETESGEMILPVENFDDMAEINYKIIEILADENLKNLQQKKTALKNWFFGEEEVGLNHYLYGENGIATSGIWGGELEVKTFSTLFQAVITYRNENALEPRVIDGFKSQEAARKYKNRDFVFELEKLPGHWNALLSESKAARGIIKAYRPQRNQYVAAKVKKQRKAYLEQIIAEYGTYAIHHQTEYEDRSISSYCKLLGITKEQYKHDLLPGQKVPPVDNKKDEIIKNPKKKKERGFDLSKDGAMFLTIAATFAVFTHCFIWPIFMPMMQAMVSANYLGLLTGLLTVAFSTSISALLTTKINLAQTQSVLEHNIEPSKGSVNAIPGSDWLTHDKDMFYLYQNSDAQSRNQAAVHAPLAEFNQRIRSKLN